MCGIFGFRSNNKLSPQKIFSGLKNLEYRGYDSWGIALKHEKKISTLKNTGKLPETLNSPLSTLNSPLSIGHTRWATHGGVTVANAHPHTDCTRKLALAHNGIFENYEEIKEELKRKNHKFKSQTDTETIVHLIEENLKTNGFATAVRDSFRRMSGLNAFVIINSISQELIAVRHGSPLIIGIASNNTYYVSSDISALLSITDRVVILNDGEMAIVGERLQIISIKSGKKVKYKAETITTNAIKDSKGKFAHFLLKEIHDQPKILKNLASSSDKSVDKLSQSIKNAFGTFMLGCGTASYAALAGTYLFSKIAKKHVNFAVGSEFEYLQDYIKKDSLIIPISQSGETIDVVEPTKEAKKKRATIVPIVNVSTSTLARIGSYHLNLNAGAEKAVVGTKSFTAMVALLLLSAYTTSGNKDKAKKLLNKSSNDVKNILDRKNTEKVKRIAKKIKGKEDIYSIGRGISYVASLEAALKLKETALIHAEGFAGGELKHGVMALIEKGTPCIVFAPKDKTYEEIISNAQEIKARGGYIIGIGPKKSSVFDEFLETEDLAEATLISQTVYMQLFAYYLALERGIKDPDKPRNLAKSVTVK